MAIISLLETLVKGIMDADSPKIINRKELV